mmetsp:Transcript_16518/g.46104  ORF Transcript_16518/g.46104 Transcript_16518/m.46104 type:complete len:231 (+) Transcript_16518:37-729(+)
MLNAGMGPLKRTHPPGNVCIQMHVKVNLQVVLPPEEQLLRPCHQRLVPVAVDQPEFRSREYALGLQLLEIHQPGNQLQAVTCRGSIALYAVLREESLHERKGLWRAVLYWVPCLRQLQVVNQAEAHTVMLSEQLCRIVRDHEIQNHLRREPMAVCVLDHRLGGRREGDLLGNVGSLQVHIVDVHVDHAVDLRPALYLDLVSHVLLPPNRKVSAVCRLPDVCAHPLVVGQA